MTNDKKDNSLNNADNNETEVYICSSCGRRVDTNLKNLTLPLECPHCGVRFINVVPPQKKYTYTVQPIMRIVSKEEYLDFVRNYPRELISDVCGICDPPYVSYVDPEITCQIVAGHHKYDEDPSGYFYCPPEEIDYKIMENHQEVYDSRIEVFQDSYIKKEKIN